MTPLRLRRGLKISMRKTAIIVPCYNEEKRLRPQEFAAAAAGQEKLHFIFVNDGSTDGTGEKLRLLCGAGSAQMSLIDMPKNSGKAEAVRQGFLAAFEADYDNIGYWDSDLATPLYDIPRFCRILDATDATIVIGARVKLLGRKIERRSVRHYTGRVFATLASLTLRLPIYDTQCGAKIFKNTEALKRVFRKPFRVTWTFDVEFLARLSLVEMANGNEDCSKHWIEYPLEEWVDIKGSKVGYTDFIKAAVEIFKIFCFLRVPWVSGRYSRDLVEPLGENHD